MSILSKKIGKIIIFVLLLTPLSCKDDFLEIPPQGSVTAANFYQTEEHAVLATNAVYAMLRRWEIHTFAYVGCTDIISDDAEKGSEPNDATFLIEVDNLTMDAGNVAPNTLWGGYYQAISRANIALERIPEIEMNENLKKRLIGELKVLRAYFYFNLVRWFGDIPLVLKPLTKDEFKQSRETVQKVYAQITQDLKDALSVLPEKSQYPPSEMGRATKGAARGLLAKAYLTIKDYANAEKYALELINSKEYDLLPEYVKIFTRDGENSSESVFEVQCTNGARATFNAEFDGSSQYNQIQGVRGTPNLGWGFNRPSDSFILEFEPGDPRRDATILYEGEVLPDGSAIVQKNPNVFNARYNQKAWVPKLDADIFNGQGNIRLLRYSDVLLIAAEAANENGKTADALRYLNLVRKRARGALPATILPDVTETAKDKLRERIWHERRVELGMEQQRWFDLVRTGQAEAALKKHGKTFRVGRSELLPIPQTEIDLSGGTLKQNPGY